MPSLAWRFKSVATRLSRPKNITNETLNHEGSQSTLGFLDLLLNVLNLVLINGLHVSTGGMSEHGGNQMTGKHFSAGLDEDLPQFFEASILLALRHLATGVDLQGLGLLVHLRILIPPTANRIEAFHAKSQRINLTMTLSAGF